MSTYITQMHDKHGKWSSEDYLNFKIYLYI